jgi:lysophospholipase L1-like esterase
MQRRPAWDDLESRLCPSLVGPVPEVPVSTVPVQQTGAPFLALQDLYKQEAAAWTPQVVFYGDSITYNFAYLFGQEAWGKDISPLNAANFGEQGDTTQNILWRIENGEFPKVPPKVVVIQAGANNLGTFGESPGVTLLGIENLVNVVHSMSPTSKILVVGMFPAGPPSDPMRPEIVQINAQLARFVDNRTSFFLNSGPEFLSGGDTLNADYEPDLVHPNAFGYQVWAGQLAGMLDLLLRIVPMPTAPPPLASP